MPQASAILVSPRLVAIPISTARMLRLESAERACLRPPAWVKQSRKPVRASSSISSEAIGANGSIPASSSFSSLASAGNVLGRQLGDDQLVIGIQAHGPGIVRHRIRESVLQLRQRGVQFLLALGDRVGGLGRFADQPAVLGLLGCHCCGVYRYVAGSAYRRDPGTKMSPLRSPSRSARITHNSQ